MSNMSNVINFEAYLRDAVAERNALSSQRAEAAAPLRHKPGISGRELGELMVARGLTKAQGEQLRKIYNLISEAADTGEPAPRDMDLARAIGQKGPDATIQALLWAALGFGLIEVSTDKNSRVFTITATGKSTAPCVLRHSDDSAGSLERAREMFAIGLSAEMAASCRRMLEILKLVAGAGEEMPTIKHLMQRMGYRSDSNILVLLHLLHLRGEITMHGDKADRWIEITGGGRIAPRVLLSNDAIQRAARRRKQQVAAGGPSDATRAAALGVPSLLAQGNATYRGGGRALAPVGPAPFCLWIEGDAKEVTARGDAIYCGAPVEAGCSWCAEHRARVFRPETAPERKFMKAVSR